MHEMIARFGLDTFKPGLEDMLALCRGPGAGGRAPIPDGEYFFADYADEDSDGGLPCRIAFTLTVKDGILIFDFTGSDPQLTSSLNMPTGGHERHALLMVGLVYVLYSLDPTLLLNSRPARVPRRSCRGAPW